jgi:hypothetical protein
MNIVMLTPLFPPDTSKSASYAKLLAKQLRDMSLTVLAYGKLPESVEGVVIKSIDKSGMKAVTVLRCLAALHKSKPSLLLAHNGPSSDLPALLYTISHPSLKLLYIESDRQAVDRATGIMQRWVISQIKKRSIKVISLSADSLQYLPTEILPFSEANQEIEQAQKKWWREHLELFNTYVS